MILRRTNRSPNRPHARRQRVKRALLGVCAFVVAFTLGVAGARRGVARRVQAAARVGRDLPARPEAPGRTATPTGRIPRPTPFFVLLIGNDDRPGVGGARGDALHLVGVNPQAAQGDDARTSRATPAGTATRSTPPTRRAEAPRRRPRSAGSSVCRVSYAVDVNFDKFQALVDGVGGVTINVPTEMHDSYSGAYFQPGVQRLNGDQALGVLP